MKIASKIVLACLFLAATLTSKGQTTGEKAIARFLEVTGGAEAYKNIQKATIKLSGTYSGSQMEILMESEFPYKWKEVMTLDGTEFSREEFTGDAGFTIQNGTRYDYTMDEVLQSRLEYVFMPEVYYKESNIAVQFMGKVKLKKQEGWYKKVKFKIAADSYSIYYYEETTGFLSRIEEEDGSYVHLSDYRDYDGFKFPYQYLIASEGITVPATVTSIRIIKKTQAGTVNTESNLSQDNTEADQVPVSVPTTPGSISPIASVNYDKKLALIVGNSNYKSGGALRNPVNDARAMSKALQQLGFDVMFYDNMSQSEMKKAIDAFGGKLKGYDVGLFYYAGHGIQYKGRNYIIPIEADLQAEQQIEYDCIAADRVLAFMEYSRSKVNIVILDACRNNPFERSWHRAAGGSGLAFMNAPTGSLIAYATSPGQTASDGSGANGLYTSALLKYMNEPGLTIEQMFKKVRAEVEERSGQQQVPWESTSLKGEFFFKPHN